MNYYCFWTRRSISCDKQYTQRDTHNKRNEIAHLHFEVQELGEYLRGLKNSTGQEGK
jgi:hypothetical protein